MRRVLIVIVCLLFVVLIGTVSWNTATDVTSAPRFSLPFGIGSSGGQGTIADADHPAPSDAVEGVPEEPEVLLQKIAEWTPNIQWSAVQPGKYEDVIVVDESHLIPANTLPGYFVVARGLDIASYKGALPQKLARTGWTNDRRFDSTADFGTRWAYRKQEGEWVRFLVFWQSAGTCQAGEGTSEVCMPEQSKVFYTDPVPGAKAVAADAAY